MRLVLLGPPGAGKGTQAMQLQEELKIPQIASGDLLRLAVRNKTALGVQAKRYMDQGTLVPDDLVIKLIEERLGDPDAGKGFILDGFPRTLAQAEALRAMLERNHLAIDGVLALVVPDQEIIKRISGRRTCKNCGAMYHTIFDPPRNVGLCNKCNGELYQRDDDAEDTVKMRLEVYDTQTRLLLTYYQDRGLLKRVEGVGSLDDVRRRMMAAVAEVRKTA
ncbi:MAG TPA: adenylate kinase [Candidatus Binataceae bacterium]|nr:adenylate kinase [Candidatus Binataceae bacterium]